MLFRSLFYHFRDKLSSTFLNYFRVSCRSSSILHVRTSVLNCFILSDVRPTVMYFITALYKKQAFSSYFFEKSGFLHFAQFFPFNLEIMTPNLPKDGVGAGIISCVPAGRSAPAWYAAPSRSRSGSCSHKSAAGSAAGPVPAEP